MHQQSHQLAFLSMMVTFGVSASFAVIMSVKHNLIDLVHEFPLSAKMAEQSFYVDDGPMGADSIERAIDLRKEVQSLFLKTDFCFVNGTPMRLESYIQ